MDEWLQKYAETFDDGFPMIPLAWGRTEEEVIAMIKSCIDAGKDAYEMGLVEDSDSIDY